MGAAMKRKPGRAIAPEHDEASILRIATHDFR
jgi:hypothetical protein